MAVMDNDANIVEQEEYPSISGVWKRSVRFADGTHAQFTLLNDDGTERKATIAEIENYEARFVPTRWEVTKCWFMDVWAWLRRGGRDFEDGLPF